MGQATKIVLCRCAWVDRVSPQAVAAVEEGLTEAGVAFEIVPDLCGLAAAGDGRLADWTGSDDLRIIACYPRTLRWLFDWAGAPLPAGAVLVNLRTTAPAEAVAAVLEGEPPRGAPTGSTEQDSGTQREGDWLPWFPVIDYDRCVDCRQCLNFCLFGVYAAGEDGRVRVVKPDGCKTFCPACARVCPQRAIIFPKYDKPPINGDEVDEAALAQLRHSGALDGLANLDAMELRRRLRARTGADGRRFATTGASESARPTEGVAAAGPSDAPREASLEALAEALDIPPQVLQDLNVAHRRQLQDRIARGTRSPSSHESAGKPEGPTGTVEQPADELGGPAGG